MINGKRIRNVERHLGYIKRGIQVIVGLGDISQFANLLKEIGFSDTLEVGEAVLPPSRFGSISTFNAEGKYEIHRDRPMETAYRTIEWHWEEWHGRYDRVEQSKLVDVPYKRYPRTFIPPPSVEMLIAASKDGRKVVVGPEIEFRKKKDAVLLHIINLFLEIFGECDVFTENLKQIIRAPIRRLNWRVLPTGRYPWSKVCAEVKQIIEAAPSGKQDLIWDRLEAINKYKPDFLAIGRAGFREADFIFCVHC